MPEFDIMSGDGTGKDEYIDFFRIPYWINDYKHDTVERRFQWMSDLDPEYPEVLYIVLWANREKPTLEEAKAKWLELFGDQREDV